MGMIGMVISVSQTELNSYLEDSSLLEHKIYEDKEAWSLEATDKDWYVDLDKAWDAIQFLLTGKGLFAMEEEPNVLTRAIFSTQFIDESQDLGYGPAHYLTVEEVKETNTKLQEVKAEELYDAAKMMEEGIYPEIWEDEEAKKYVLDAFKNLQNLYAKAAKNKEAIIAYLS